MFSIQVKIIGLWLVSDEVTFHCKLQRSAQRNACVRVVICMCVMCMCVLLFQLAAGDKLHRQ